MDNQKLIKILRDIQLEGNSYYNISNCEKFNKLVEEIENEIEEESIIKTYKVEIKEFNYPKMMHAEIPEKHYIAKNIEEIFLQIRRSIASKNPFILTTDYPIKWNIINLETNKIESIISKEEEK